MLTAILSPRKTLKKAILCPKCGNEMDEMQSNKQDLALKRATFGIFNAVRFLCYGCFWEERKIRNKVERRNGM